MTVMMTAEAARAFFAEELRVSFSLTSPALVDALATVPREQFLPPGPWMYRAEGSGASKLTDSDDPRHVYHNVAVAIDAARNLYNGQPGLVAGWIQQLGVSAGERVVHIGCGTGYFTALLAHVVGPTGHVHAVDVDADLAARARAALAASPWVTVETGDGRTGLPKDADVVLVHAGATHVLDEWLDALGPRGRLLCSLTVSMPAMGASLGKGAVVLIARNGDAWSARLLSMVAIYSLVGLRDADRESALGQAFRSSPMPLFTRLRRDPHDAGPACWLHGPTSCLSA